MKVFLDDVRVAPKGWILVKTPKEAINLLKTGEVTHLSLDNDLGDDKNIGTGYDVLLWLENKVYFNELSNVPEITIHSSNISAKMKMIKVIVKIFEMWNQKYLDKCLDIL